MFFLVWKLDEIVGRTHYAPVTISRYVDYRTFVSVEHADICSVFDVGCAEGKVFGPCQWI